MKRVIHLFACALLLTPIGVAKAQQSCDPDGDSACCTSSYAARCCKPGNKSKGLYFGVEATYLAPLYDESNADFTLFDGGILGPSISTQSSIDTAEELTGAPRLTLGYTACNGVGIQGRYWELNNHKNTDGLFAPLDPFAGNQIQSVGGTDTFGAYTMDLELTKEFCRRNWNLLGTFGVRYANIEHNRVERAAGTMNLDSYSLAALSRESFHGTGLTFSLSGMRSLNRCRGLAFYGSARGSTLWGPATTQADAVSSFVGPVGIGASPDAAAVVKSDETMFIGEIGAGLQWSRCVQSFTGRMFARAGVEYQYWGTNDSTAVAGAISANLLNSAGTVLAQGGDQETNLIGLSLMTGFAW